MTTCIICGDRLGPSRYEGLLKCRGCGFVTADVELSEQELRELYGTDYFHGDEYRDYLAESQIATTNLRERLKSLLRSVREPGTKRLFEIGSAYGFFLRLAGDSFSKVQGIDISEEAAAYARNELGCDIVAGDFEHYSPTRPIDVAVMWDTIEHLQHPERYIQKLSQLMNKGGILAITTGDIESLMARIRGQKWRQIHPPTHLHYFSKKTLALLLEKNGFRIREMNYCGNVRTLDTAFYTILVLKRKQQRLYDFLKRTGLLGLRFNVNLNDIMFVIAEKT